MHKRQILNRNLRVCYQNSEEDLSQSEQLEDKNNQKDTSTQLDKKEMQLFQLPLKSPCQKYSLSVFEKEKEKWKEKFWG